MRQPDIDWQILEKKTRNGLRKNRSVSRRGKKAGGWQFQARRDAGKTDWLSEMARKRV
jgi:hypothetical protein